MTLRMGKVGLVKVKVEVTMEKGIELESCLSIGAWLTGSEQTNKSMPISSHFLEGDFVWTAVDIVNFTFQLFAKTVAKRGGD